MIMEILIADDEKYIREELKNTIERITPGNSYHFARNFDTALEEMKNNEIDIAFLDIRMPGKTGIELARAIKIIKPDINIIIVTAYADYAFEALRLYVSGYVLKPFRDKDIEDALNNLRKPLCDPPHILLLLSGLSASAILNCFSTTSRSLFPVRRKRNCSPI